MGAPETLRTTRRQRGTPTARAAALVPEFARRAVINDRDNRLPLENVADLHAAGLLGLTVPASAGGFGGGLADAVSVVSTVSRGDASTALLLSLHYQWQAAIARSPRWPAHLRHAIGHEAATEPALINALRVEPELGTPVRGGLPATRARRVDGGWRISGRKVYSTGAALLRHAVVWAAAEVDGALLTGYFLLPMSAAGITLVPTWDHLGMRATVSDDVILDEVFVPADHAVDLRPPDAWAAPDTLIASWNPVLIAAAYAGIPEAARDWLVGWLNGRAPSNLGAPLSSLYRFQTVVGEIEGLIAVNRRLLTHFALEFDAADQDGLDELPPAEDRRTDPGSGLDTRLLPPTDAGLVKHAVTGNAIRALELAVEAAGNPALMRANPLERLHRDVLCSRIHSPQNDMILTQAGRLALGLC